MQFVEHVADLIGNTPLVRLGPVAAGIEATVLAKLEYFNPGGSVKDRIALRMVEAAEASGELQPGGTIVEPTSGNTGVGLAIVAQRKGYQCVFVCPDKVSEDKRNVLRAYGAEVVVCPTAVEPDHPDSYYSVSDRLVGRDRRRLEAQPVRQPAQPASRTTCRPAPSCGRRPTGGSRTSWRASAPAARSPAPGRYLKEVSDGRVQVIGADPEGSVYSGGTGRPYLVEGVGEDFWPTTYDKDICDRIVAVSDADSFAMTRRLAREEALLVGGSCGMATVAALRVAAELARGRGGRRAAARRRARLPRQDLQRRLDGGLRLPAARDRAPRSATCCAARTAPSPRSCTRTPTRPSPTPRHYLREFDVSQMPVVRAEPPVMAAEVVGSVVERDLLDALFTGRAQLSDRLDQAHVAAAADHRGERGARHGDERVRRGRRRAGAGRRQARGRGDPLGRARLPGLTGDARVPRRTA